MKFIEALELLSKGKYKKMRSKYWGKWHYLKLDDTLSLVDESGHYPNITSIQILRDSDWEVKR